MSSPANSQTRADQAAPEKTAPSRPGLRCLYCGQPAGIVWVHGHGQCAACGTNVDECCRGEGCKL